MKIHHRIKKFLKTRNIYDVLNIILILFILIVIFSFIKEYNKDYSYSKIKKINRLEYENTINVIDIEKENISTSTEIQVSKSIKKEGLYLKIIDSCENDFSGDGCVRARSCPGLSCPAIVTLRNNIMLETDGEKTVSDGITWYHVIFSEWIRYPERTSKDWYISGDYVEIMNSYKEKINKEASTNIDNNKKIIIDISEQKLYAYEGDEIFMEIYISSGLDDLPTPRGNFEIFEKTPSRYMQGPLPGISDQYYDLPGVPWTMYFTKQGAAIHGAYWHDNFGSQWSHGCVNLRPFDAEKLYNWTEIGTKVSVTN